MKFGWLREMQGYLRGKNKFWEKHKYVPQSSNWVSLIRMFDLTSQGRSAVATVLQVATKDGIDNNAGE